MTETSLPQVAKSALNMNDVNKGLDEAESRRIRPHYFNLTRKEYVVTRSDVRYYEFRCSMKVIGWSSKDDIIYIENWNVIASDEFPLLWDEERNQPGSLVADFKLVRDEPIDALFAHYEMTKHMRNIWFSYVKREHSIDLEKIEDDANESEE